MADWIKITIEDDIYTNLFPADESVVEVLLADGSQQDAWFGFNIMESGGTYWLAVDADGEPGEESIADRVVAWRQQEQRNG